MLHKLIKFLHKLSIIMVNLLLLSGLIIIIVCCLNDFKANYPVIKLQLLGDLEYINPQDIEILLGQEILVNNNLWTLNLNMVKDKLSLNPWIDKVILKKCWPNILEISIIAHKPIAIFNDNYFLTASGKVLDSTKNSVILNNLGLPKLFGQVGKENLLLNTYLLLLEKLSPCGLLVQRLDFNLNEGIIVLLSNNVKLKLGTFDIFDRITRFVGIYKKKFYSSINDISYVDLRYTNGVAVAMNK